MSGDAINRAADRSSLRGTMRTFVAIDLPAPILHALTTTQQQLQSFLRAQRLDAALRWSPIKNLHLTLRFLGDTTPAQREQVLARLQAVVTKSQPFILRVNVGGQGLGGFPNLRQPHVLWSGLAGELGALGQLQAQIEAMAQAIGFAPEEKAYSPHLTLARAAREADRRTISQVGKAVLHYAQPSATSDTASKGAAASEKAEAVLLSFAVDRVVFYQSELGAGGSRYTALATLPLADV